jgi:membrane protease YdiL (CAAX protease family)
MTEAGPRRVRASTLIGALSALAVSLAVAWGVLFAGSAVFELERATGGLVQPALVGALVTALLVGAVLRLERVSLAEVGVTVRGMARGLAVLAVVYAGIQLGLAATALLAGDGIHAGTALRADPRAVLGGVIAQLLGTALVEEAVFRGFLLRQLALRMRLAPAVAAAALAFALWHLPHRADLGLRGLELAASIAVAGLGGVLASYLYLRSSNLWIVVALHALFNDAVPLVASPVSPQWILGALVLGVIAWIERGERNHRNTTGTPAGVQPG